MFKIGEIRELIRLLDETNISELKVDTDDMKLHIKKATAEGLVLAAPAAIPSLPTPPVQGLGTAAPSHAVRSAEPAEAGQAAGGAGAVAAESENIHIVKSPMVGTFYRSPAPDAPPFVEVGSKVSEKTVVCIVEAMKLMNEIEAEATGEVVEILAQNAQLVEYGQPLLKIRLS